MNDNARRWFGFAQEDLRVAEVIFAEGLFNQVCFHAQQCVEKTLKALLSQRGKVPPRTHSITDLLNILPSGWFSGLRTELEGLDDYYIPTRYPDALPGTLPAGLPGKAQAEEVLGLAQKTIQIAIRLLK